MYVCTRTDRAYDNSRTKEVKSTLAFDWKLMVLVGRLSLLTRFCKMSEYYFSNVIVSPGVCTCNITLT